MGMSALVLGHHQMWHEEMDCASWTQRQPFCLWTGKLLPSTHLSTGAVYEQHSNHVQLQSGQKHLTSELMTIT
jgi:hypothetical protein